MTEWDLCFRVYISMGLWINLCEILWAQDLGVKMVCFLFVKNRTEKKIHSIKGIFPYTAIICWVWHSKKKKNPEKWYLHAAAEMCLKPFIVLQISWLQKGAAKASYEMCDFSLGNLEKRAQNVKVCCERVRSNQNNHNLGGFLLTISDSVCCTVTWNVAQHVWCRCQWWEMAGCFLHAGLL